MTNDKFLVLLGLLLVTSTVFAQDPKLTRTRTITLTERAGVARTQVPVEVTVRFEQAALDGGQSLRLVKQGSSRTAVPFQVVHEVSPGEKNSFAPQPQTFVRLIFPADVPAGGTAVYEVGLEGPAAPAPAQPLKVTGQGMDKTVDTGRAVFELDKASGQLLAFRPTAVSQDRLVFVQQPERGPKPFHWNPDVWAPPAPWGHTSDWTTPRQFDSARNPAELPTAGQEKEQPYFYKESPGPLAYRLSRWGKMPFLPQVETSVTYTFFAGSPVVQVQSLMEFHEGTQVHAVRNAELVFSRHQFDTAVWITKDGKLHTAPCYDYDDPDRSFQIVAKLPADVPCLGFANGRKGYGIALVTRSVTNLNKYTGQAADEQAHFAVRDYDEHGKGNPYNFLYFVRYLVFRDGYGPTYVRRGSTYTEDTSLVVFQLDNDANQPYQQLLTWHRMLASPLEVAVD